MENNGQVDADGEQKVITMVEFLEEQEELEKEAAEILPGDHDQCTYHQGNPYFFFVQFKFQFKNIFCFCDVEELIVSLFGSN